MASAIAPAGKPEETLPRCCHHLIPTPRDVHARLRRSRYILGECSYAKAVVWHGWGTCSHRHLASRVKSHCCPRHSPASLGGRIQPQRGKDPHPQLTAPMGSASPRAEPVAQGAAPQLPFPTSHLPCSQVFRGAERTPPQPLHRMLLGPTTPALPGASTVLVPEPLARAVPALPKGGHDVTAFAALQPPPTPQFAPAQAPSR